MTGQVVDSLGHPVGGVTIYGDGLGVLKFDGTKMLHTNSHGQFFVRVRPGRWKFLANTWPKTVHLGPRPPVTFVSVRPHGSKVVVVLDTYVAPVVVKPTVAPYVPPTPPASSTPAPVMTLASPSASPSPSSSYPQ